MTGIKLNFINKSNDVNNSKVVIFQKNTAITSGELSVAWKLIKNCGRNDNHPFVYPMPFEVSASDSSGNNTPIQDARNGQNFQMIKTTSGDELQFEGSTKSSGELLIKNDLAAGSITVSVYKDGLLLATQTNVSPQEKAVFDFKPTLFIGVASQVVEGELMNSAITSSINTELNILGVASADIVMTGGGAGPNDSPFAFTLENIQFA